MSDVDFADITTAVPDSSAVDQRAWRRYALEVPAILQFVEGCIENARLVDFSAIGLRTAFAADEAPCITVPRGARVLTLLSVEGREPLHIETTLTRAFRNQQVLELCLSHPLLSPDTFGALLQATANALVPATLQKVNQEPRPIDVLNSALDECFARLGEHLLVQIEWANVHQAPIRPWFALSAQLNVQEVQIRMLAHQLLRAGEFDAIDAATMTQLMITAFVDRGVTENIAPMLRQVSAQAAVASFRLNA